MIRIHKYNIIPIPLPRTVTVNLAAGGNTDKDGDNIVTYGDSITIDPTADSGWYFFEWLGDASGSDDPLIISPVLTDLSITPDFELIDYILTIGVGSGNGTTDPPGGYGIIYYNYNTGLEIEAIPDPGWEFFDWSGETGKIVNPAVALTNLIVPLYDNTSILANFIKIEYILTIGVSSGSGSVSPPTGTTYNYDSGLAIQALPDVGWNFDAWTGDTGNLVDPDAGSTNLVNPLFGNTNVQANFVELGCLGEVGVFGGGNTGSIDNVISCVSINTAGNAKDFGDLTRRRYNLAACSNGANDRGVFAGGYGSLPSGNANNIDYVTISSKGDATNFGSLTIARELPCATSNGTNERGIFAGGLATSTYYNQIQYITISSTGNAALFGILTTRRTGNAGLSNGVNNRGVFGGHEYPYSTIQNYIEYITISTTGNAADFGDLTAPKSSLSGCSNSINNRGVFGGGYAGGYSNVIEYITITTTGNATDFGDLTVPRSNLAATSNGIGNRGIFGGGFNFGRFSEIDYITIPTAGNATDFGDLTAGTSGIAACSNT